MAFLSDFTIAGCISVGRIVIDPYDPDCLQPASYDMHLDRFFKTIKTLGPIDPREPVEYNETEVEDGDVFRLEPRSCALASTVERVELAHDLIGRLEGKSSLGRIFLTAHITAGFFDPGFRGHATLELFNASNRVVLLVPGMKIAQMSFARLTSHARRPYGHRDLASKYMDQPRGPMGSKMHENFEK